MAHWPGTHRAPAAAGLSAGGSHPGLWPDHAGGFHIRGGKLLGHRSVGDLPCQLLSSHQLYSTGKSSITFELGSFTPCFFKDKTAPEFLFSPPLKLLESELRNTHPGELEKQPITPIV